MSKLFEALPAEIVAGAPRSKMTARPKLMWPSPAQPFSDSNWLFERGLQGTRCLARRSEDGLHLLAADGTELADSYPTVCEELQAQPQEEFLVDGVIVPEATRVSFYVFDLLYLQGRDLRLLPLRQRKNLLKRSFRFTYNFRYTAHRNGNGEDFHRQASDRGWPSIIAKKADSQYDPRQSTLWLELPCEDRPRAWPRKPPAHASSQLRRPPRA